MRSQTIRTFIAIPIPEGVSAWLRQIQDQLRLPGLNVRWLAARNVHLTLKFLGDIDPARVSEIAAQVDVAAATIPSFRLQAKGVGVFPNFSKARVLWVGLTGDVERLRTLQANLETGLEAVGFAREGRGFRAHLTIGRARQHLNARMMLETLESLKAAASDAFPVDRLSLYQSTLKPAGAQYTLLHSAHLENAPKLGED